MLNGKLHFRTLLLEFEEENTVLEELRVKRFAVIRQDILQYRTASYRRRLSKSSVAERSRKVEYCLCKTDRSEKEATISHIPPSCPMFWPVGEF